MWICFPFESFFNSHLSQRLKINMIWLWLWRWLWCRDSRGTEIGETCYDSSWLPVLQVVVYQMHRLEVALVPVQLNNRTNACMSERTKQRLEVNHYKIHRHFVSFLATDSVYFRRVALTFTYSEAHWLIEYGLTSMNQNYTRRGYTRLRRLIIP